MRRCCRATSPNAGCAGDHTTSDRRRRRRPAPRGSPRRRAARRPCATARAPCARDTRARFTTSASDSSRVERHRTPRPRAGSRSTRCPTPGRFSDISIDAIAGADAELAQHAGALPRRARRAGRRCTRSARRPRPCGSRRSAGAVAVQLDRRLEQLDAAPCTCRRSSASRRTPRRACRTSTSGGPGSGCRASTCASRRGAAPTAACPDRPACTRAHSARMLSQRNAMS